MNITTTNETLQNLRDTLRFIQADAILVSMRCSFDNHDSNCSDVRAISGFSGSNGRAIVSQSKAILAVDGRYTTQALKQTDGSIWQIEQYPEATVVGMIKQVLKQGETIAISAMAHSYKSYMDLIKQIESAGFKVKTIDPHPVIAYRQQANIKNEIIITESDYIPNRINIVKQNIADNEVILLANKETISWIFGTRKTILGIDKSPVANAIALFTKSEKPIMFSDLPIRDNDFFEHYTFDQLANIMNNFKNMTVKASYSDVPAYFILYLIKNAFPVMQLSNNYTTCESLKTQKEIENQKIGAYKTSIAFIKTLAYIDYYVKKGEKITEQDAINYFETEDAIDVSFIPICSSAENTAIVHYNPNLGNNAIIKKDALFLFDAGFHFTNSTTDMTRTTYIGDNPSEEFKHVYTVILKSFIFYTMCKFPNNTYACTLDAICRYHMWQNGIDYNFGTGHGVGIYRSVHEAPHIGKNSPDLITANMITTVEPGYYTDNYGIRIENMLLSISNQQTNLIEFETITHVPFCNRLINKELLDKESIEWLNKYHSDISRTFLPVFKNDPIVTSWIIQNTKIL